VVGDFSRLVRHKVGMGPTSGFGTIYGVGLDFEGSFFGVISIARCKEALVLDYVQFSDDTLRWNISFLPN
jgi:hypothetical protein